MKKRISFILLIAITVILAACGNGMSNGSSSDDKGEKDSSKEVKVQLKNNDNKSVGTAMLTEKSNGVNIELDGKNLPKGSHAFHIHEKSACKAPDFESAGGHFNPDDSDHGFNKEDGPHAGDMPNILVDKDGTVKQSFLLKNITLEKDKDFSLFDGDGTALVIHEDEDDNETQPTGDAGDRLACGAIKE